jgi:hypothetical protein
MDQIDDHITASEVQLLERKANRDLGIATPWAESVVELANSKGWFVVSFEHSFLSDAAPEKFVEEFHGWPLVLVRNDWSADVPFQWLSDAEELLKSGDLDTKATMADGAEALA